MEGRKPQNRRRVDPARDPQVRRSKKERQRRRVLKRVRWHHVVLAACCLVVMAVMIVANFLTPDKSFSDEENRVLAGKPKLSFSSLTSGKYMTDYESYVADQFPWRNGWIHLKLNIERLFGKSESNGVYLGKDDYLIEQLSEPDTEAVDRNLDAISAFSKKHSDLKVHTVFVPNAAYICADKLPFQAPVRSQKEDLLYLSSGLAAEAGFVDLTEALIGHNDEQLYYRTDHHWTSLGAYYAFEGLKKTLELTEEIDWENLTVTNDFQGTLASKSGVTNVYDSIDIYEPKGIDNNYVVAYDDTMEKTATVYDMGALETKDKYTVFLGGNHSLITIDTENTNKRCLMIFKDSYANSFIPFLTPYFEKIIIIDPRYYYGDAELLIRSEGVTDIMFFYNVNTFMTDHSLADVLEAEAGSDADGLDTDTAGGNDGSESGTDDSSVGESGGAGSSESSDGSDSSSAESSADSNGAAGTDGNGSAGSGGTDTESGSVSDSDMSG